MKVISTIIIFVFSNYCLWAQEEFKVNFPDQSVGAILIDRSTPIGTGFVLLNNHFVITCYHVAKVKGEKWFFPLNSHKIYRLELFEYVEQGDIAIFKSYDSIPTTPLIADTTFIFNNKVSIGYSGFDGEQSSPNHLKMIDHTAIIEANGKMDAPIDGLEISTTFIEFVGKGLPGYSGSPIFNDKGEVIAILSMAYFRESISGPEEKVLINRALTIKPIVEAYKQKK
jgi:S1-C subfamily serine protease